MKLSSNKLITTSLVYHTCVTFLLNEIPHADLGPFILESWVTRNYSFLNFGQANQLKSR